MRKEIKMIFNITSNIVIYRYDPNKVASNDYFDARKSMILVFLSL